MKVAEEKKLSNAKFIVKGKNKAKFEVQFNPQSLKYNVSNTLKGGRKEKVAQHVTRTTAKLSMELIFDSTHTGKDVRIETIKIAKLMKPKKLKKTASPTVTFSWGTYKFDGILESFNETIDFFAPNGTPLRSSISISLVSHKVTFKQDPNSPFDDVNKSSMSTFANSARGVQQVAAKLGDPIAAREIAQANNLENMRLPGKESIEIGLSLSGNIGTKVLVGGLTLPGTENISGGAIGSKLSAGISATGGAFAGLRNVASTPIRELDIDNLVSDSGTAGLDLQASASVGLGGQASISTGTSATFKVGEAGDLKKTLEFDSDLL